MRGSCVDESPGQTLVAHGFSARIGSDLTTVDVVDFCGQLNTSAMDLSVRVAADVSLDVLGSPLHFVR